MALDQWPLALPQRFETNGFAEAIGDGLVRSATDMGPAKMRRRSSAMPRRLSGRMIMHREQIPTLRTFVETTIMGGALPFQFPDPTTGQPAIVRLVEMPSWSALSSAWFEVSLSIEVLP